MRFISDIWPLSRLLRRRAQILLEATKIGDFLKEGGYYLDIGCGKGHMAHTLEKFNEEKGVQFLIIDAYDYPSRRVKKRISETRKMRIEPALKKLEKQTKSHIRRLDFTKEEGQTFAFARVENLPFKAGVFDGVTLFYVLHHLEVENQKRAIDEAKRIIGDNPDQYIFISEDIVDSERQRKLTERVDRILNWETKAEPHNYRSDEEWARFFKELGLEIVKSHYYSDGSTLKSITQAFYVLRKR